MSVSPKTPGIQIRILSESKFVDAVVADASKYSNIMEVLSAGVVSTPTNLGFDLSVVKEIVAIAKDLFFAGPIVPLLLAWIKQTKPKVIVIETPFRKITLDLKDGDATEERVRDILKKLAEV